MLEFLKCRYSHISFAYAVPIGGLAGLIGLGGGEFRLPVLTHVIGFPPKSAIPLNLMISLATLAAALVTRNHAVSVGSVGQHLPEVLGLMLGGIVSAIYGAHVVSRLSDKRLLLAMAALLASLGILLLVEAFVSFGDGLLLTETQYMRAGAGVLIGLGVGVVSSMLGVAGGELLIPALIFVFGADIRIAGTASLLVSIVIVSTGIWRYHRAGNLPLSGGAPRIAVSMSAGSLLGAALGGLAVAVAPVAFLKAFLGVVLIVAAIKTARH